MLSHKITEDDRSC